MMKFGETSILSLFIILHKKLFPWVGKYYAGNDCPHDGYEHYWTGFIANALIAVMMKLWFWVWIAWPIAFLLHVVVKEVILDKKKRDTMVQHELDAFKIDMTLRICGFVEWVWMPLLSLR